MKSTTSVANDRIKARLALVAGMALLPMSMPSVAQQDAAEPIAIDGLHSFELRVSDVERSLEFYQGLFGAPVISRLGDNVSLQIGDGPHYFTLAPTRRDEQPHIHHFALSVPGFNIFDLQRQLSDHGITRTVETLYDGRSSLETAGLTWTVRLPGEGEDMMTENHHLYVADPNGIPVQLSSPDACGAGEGRGVPCELEPAPEEGLIELREINHFTTYVANYEVTNDFYRNLFGLGNQAFQGTFPLLGLSDGRQFMMFVGGTQPGTPAQPGRIDHASLNIENFTEESVLERLTEYGLTARPAGEDARPLQHWVSRRMPERGGAPGGTPEVYLSDPDGIHIQLQHHTYCGGGGVFGENC
ncbi:VOC family protein [Pseudohongiella acticola]|jgi:catechol 2,3-dioxygenase-like lactoylglutathione lyase family enzyme|uniref:VOC family protein n=1 Tax=Pseudohongiella acticola TaxID=1524254 RepID=UPI0030EED99C